MSVLRHQFRVEEKGKKKESFGFYLYLKCILDYHSFKAHKRLKLRSNKKIRCENRD